MSLLEEIFNTQNQRVQEYIFKKIIDSNQGQYFTLIPNLIEKTDNIQLIEGLEEELLNLLDDDIKAQIMNDLAILHASLPDTEKRKILNRWIKSSSINEKSVMTNSVSGIENLIITANKDNLQLIKQLFITSEYPIKKQILEIIRKNPNPIHYRWLTEMINGKETSVNLTCHLYSTIGTLRHIEVEVYLLQNADIIISEMEKKEKGFRKNKYFPPAHLPCIFQSFADMYSSSSTKQKRNNLNQLIKLMIRGLKLGQASIHEPILNLYKVMEFQNLDTNIKSVASTDINDFAFNRYERIISKSYSDEVELFRFDLEQFDIILHIMLKMSFGNSLESFLFSIIEDIKVKGKKDLIKRDTHQLGLQSVILNLLDFIKDTHTQLVRKVVSSYKEMDWRSTIKKKFLSIKEYVSHDDLEEFF